MTRIALLCLALVAVAKGQGLDEVRTEYEIALDAGPFEGRHLQAGEEICNWLEAISQNDAIHLTIEPFDDGNTIESHYKMRERTFLDTPDGYFAKNGIVPFVENSIRLDGRGFEGNTRCRTSSVTFRGAIDQNNLESHPCFPRDFTGEPRFENTKLRLEEEVEGTCETQARVSGRQKWTNRTDQGRDSFLVWSTVSDATTHFPRFFDLANLPPANTPLIVTDSYAHFRIDDIEVCIGDNVRCPPVNAGTTSAEYMAVTRPNTRGRLEVLSRNLYVPDPNAPRDIFDVSFKVQISDKTGADDVSWNAARKAENVWRENFIEDPDDNQGRGVGRIPYFNEAALFECVNRPFFPTALNPTIRKRGGRGRWHNRKPEKHE